MIIKLLLIAFLIAVLPFSTYAFYQKQETSIYLSEIKDIRLSLKLKSYINKVERITKRRVSIEERDTLGVPGMNAAFIEHPTDIRVLVLSNWNTNDPDIENTIAHEITHGLLAYGKGYVRLKPKRNLSSLEANTVGLLSTMIDDLVVNNLIHKAGFKAFGNNYPMVLRNEISGAKNKQDFYEQFNSDLTFKSRFIVFRYILAWGSLKYSSPNKEMRGLLASFLGIFPKAYPSEYKTALEVQRLILHHDLFSPTQYQIVIKDLVNMWQLNDVVELVKLTDPNSSEH